MKLRVGWAGLFYALGYLWNRYLFNLGGFFGDWITCGRWLVCVGDLFYLLAFAVLLSIPLRERLQDGLLRS